MKQKLIGLNKQELRDFVARFGEPSYRADQLFKAIYGRRLQHFDDITDLPKSFRNTLCERTEISTMTTEMVFPSEDGTRRYLFKTADGNPVETVFLPSEKRDTICFSSQSGCALDCDFCLTAKLGLLRNLTSGEILEQIITVLNDVYGVGSETPHGTNLVAMGAGEPFMNFDNLIHAISILGEEDGLFIVPNRITVSTVGIVPKIREFAGVQRRPHLAISLSAPNDELRSRLMPINTRWNIDELMTAANDFESSLKRGERFTFEYVLLGGVNDSVNIAKELVDVIKKYRLKRVKINLIPYNSADGIDYASPDENQIRLFKTTLENNGIDAFVRTPRGRDVFAACGQLAARREEKNLASAGS